MNLWYNTASAPSRAIERDAVAHILRSQGVPDCAVSYLDQQIRDGDGARVIMHPTGGWSGPMRFDPEMSMSYSRNGIDGLANVIAAEPTEGLIYVARCNGESTHIAYWPVCGNLARLSLADTRSEAKPVVIREFGSSSLHGAPTQPASVPEPGTLVLLLAGLLWVGYRLWRQ